MPQPNEILAGLQGIANLVPLAVGWHLALFAVLNTLVVGWRPTRQVAGGLMVLPVISVSVMAWLFDNPFNGAVFAVLAVVLAFIAARAEQEPVFQPGRWEVIVGSALVAFAWAYPHFNVGPRFAPLLASPMGLIPSPTMALLLGLTLMGGSPRSRTWFLVLGFVGMFYGLYGAGRLGVWIDLALFGGAAAVAYVAGRRQGFAPPRFGAHA